jgi:predicted ATPase
VAFHGDKVRELAAQFLTLAEKQRATAPLMIGHRVMGFSLLMTGDLAESRTHLDRAVALYDPAEHRRLAARFGVDTGMLILCYRSWAQWMLGYPEAALVDIDDALKNAREIGQAATLMFGLFHASLSHRLCGNYLAANALVEELVALADEKGAFFWKAFGMLNQGCMLALTGKPSDAVHTITAGITALRSTGATLFTPLQLSYLAGAYAELGNFDDGWRCINEAMTLVETTKESLWEAEVNRIAGELARMPPEPDAAKAEGYFERALAVARAQQAKSWELRAATTWRGSGAIRASGMKPAMSSLRSTVGSAKASTRST